MPRNKNMDNALSQNAQAQLEFDLLNWHINKILKNRPQCIWNRVVERLCETPLFLYLKLVMNNGINDRIGVILKTWWYGVSTCMILSFC